MTVGFRKVNLPVFRDATNNPRYPFLSEKSRINANASTPSFGKAL